MSTLTRHVTTLAVAAFLCACSGDSDEDAPTSGAGGSPAAGGSGGAPASEVTFTDDIHPILLAKCSGSDCHDGSNAPILPGHAADDVQEAYDATQAPYQGGQPVYERILARISATEPAFMMPPSFANPPCLGTIGSPGCISQAELDLIEEWIDAGTPL